MDLQAWMLADQRVGHEVNLQDTVPEEDYLSLELGAAGNPGNIH